MSDLFDRLLAGPDSVKEHTLRDGSKFLSRSGTRSERNQVEKKFANEDFLMDACATTLWLLVAEGDGSRKFGGDKKEFQKFAEGLDYDLATEMAAKIRGSKTDDEDDGDLTLDERVEKHLKNSQAAKEAT